MRRITHVHFFVLAVPYCIQAEEGATSGPQYPGELVQNGIDERVRNVFEDLRRVQKTDALQLRGNLGDRPGYQFIGP